MSRYPQTRQEIFDRVWAHFVENGRPLSYTPKPDGGVLCQYHGVYGARCAVGIFVEEKPTKEVNGANIGELASWCRGRKKPLLADFLLKNIIFLVALQQAHDIAAREGTPIEDGLRRAAIRFRLKAPK